MVSIFGALEVASRLCSDLQKDIKKFIVIDIGCGGGDVGSILRGASRGKYFYLIGLDIWLPFLKNCKRCESYDDLILAHAAYLPIKNNSGNFIIALDVIEHLKRNEGLKMLQEIERISKGRIILTTPRFFRYKDISLGNPYQIHLSFWNIKDFKKHGYKVRGLPKDKINLFIPFALTWYLLFRSTSIFCEKVT